MEEDKVPLYPAVQQENKTQTLICKSGDPELREHSGL